MASLSRNKIYASRIFIFVCFVVLAVYFLQSKGKKSIKLSETNDLRETNDDLLNSITKLKDENNQLKKTCEKKREPKICEANSHSVCFIGKRFCHPGYTGDDCNQKLVPANPWYSEDCPNLRQDITFDIDMPLEMFYTKDNCSTEEISGITGCANLCFSHPVSGVPQIPLVFWKQVQANEAKVWKGMGGGNDRIAEHLEGFDNYKTLPSKFCCYKRL